jgi:hypothetical protein
MSREQQIVEKLARELAKLIYNFGVQGIILGGVIAILNEEIPDFKERLIAKLESATHPSDAGQAMIDEAIDYAKTIR